MIFDDFINIRPIYRIAFQSLISILMIMMSGEYLIQVGDLFGFGQLNLGIIAIPFTVLCCRLN